MTIEGGTFTVTDPSGPGNIWNQRPSANINDGQGVVTITGGTFNNVMLYDDFKDYEGPVTIPYPAP